jgi:restriction system protein
LRYWIPSISFQSFVYKGLAAAAPGLANIVAMLLLFAAALSAFSAWRRGKLLENQKDIESLRAISWQAFEELVGEVYRRKGYTVAENGGGGADGGVDLVLRRGGEKILVQCKHWKMEKIGVKVVRELYGVIAAEGATGGVVISSGTFSKEAKEFGKNKPLELIDGRELLRLIADIKKASVPSTKSQNDSICPLCRAEMILRTAKRGPNEGEKFWGCSAFPKCRGTRPYIA